MIYADTRDIKKPKNQPSGFTIVELIVVIIVIAILVTITAIAYSSVTNMAKQKGVETDARAMASALTKYKTENGTYPTNLSDMTSQPQTTSTFQYTYTASTRSYCLTASITGFSMYMVSGNSTVTKGACPGHGLNGNPPITNIAKNPIGSGSSSQYATSGWFSTICGTDAVDTAGISWNSQTNWHRMAWSGSGCNTLRMNFDLSNLQNGATYTISALVGNDGSSSTSFTMDLADQNQTTFTLNPGDMRTINFSASRSTYDSTYRFLDINPGTGNGVLINKVMVTQGTTVYNYADGSSPNWVWNGTAYASTSTGPAL